MARPKKPKPPPPPNKRNLVERLVEKPSQGIVPWLQKEYVILKQLEQKFPLLFLDQLKFSKKLPSLAVLFCDWMDKDLQTRYRAYKFVPPEQNQVLLGEKIGEDYKVEKKPSLRDLLK